MKKSKQCPKCHGVRIGCLADQGDDDTIEGERLAATEERTHGARASRSPFAIGLSDSKVRTRQVVRSQRFEVRLEAFICADCGYYESYVKAPDVVPWDDLEGFSWVNAQVADAGPYR